MLTRATLKEALEDLLTVEEIAAEHGMTKRRVYALADRLGLRDEVRRGSTLAKAIRPTLAALAETERPTEAVRMLVDFVLEAWPEQDRESLAAVMAHGFTQLEAALLLALDDPRGRVVPRDELCRRLKHAAVMRGEVEEGSLNVHVCRVRRRLADLAWPIAVRNAWGVGFALDVMDRDWSMPEAPPSRRPVLRPTR